ncbi:hypothetical protein [Streptomyces griseochromogenes]|uniref:hypothetical protein n=1 Tax=Streptomyces griseochromogenes TaxID=68214 RepID=UPI00379D728C
MYRHMAGHDPSAHREGLALTLHDLGRRLFEVGRPHDAAAAAEESVGLWRDVAAADLTLRSRLAAASHDLTAFRRQTERQR